jgi:uncharacterized protein (DUF2141 family)
LLRWNAFRECENPEYKKQYWVIACAILNQKGFPSKFLKFASKTMLTQISGKDSFEFSDIKPGKYAIAVIHDENCNGELDTNMFGIPTEGYGFPVVQKSQ